MRDFDDIPVTIILPIPPEPPYDKQALRRMLDSAVTQDHRRCECVIADASGQPWVAARARDASARHIARPDASTPALINAALEQAAGGYVVLLRSDAAAVFLRHSAIRTMLMAAERLRDRETDVHRPVGLVYSDYERIAPDGTAHEVHLLDWHEGRLRDGFDMGYAWLIPADLLHRIGGMNPQYTAAAWYDLRLRLTEGRRAVHVANRYAGSLHAVQAEAKGHNVFDYLLSSREAQKELESACTEHLKRIGAYLAPSAHVRRVPDAGGPWPDDAPIASVVTPVHRRPGFIGRAIESVQNQTVRNVEMIVVVNGGEDDPTCDAVRAYMPGGERYDADKPPVRLIVVDVNNLGLCLNAGLAAARGRYYVQLDSDDRLKPDAIEKLLAVFEQDETVGMVIGSYEVWTLDEATGELHRNEEIPVVTHDEWTAENGRNNLLRINGAGAPRAANIAVIREVGWFGVNDTPSCRNYGEDYDLVLRISERYTIGRVWDPIYEVIRHSGGTDHAIDQATIDRNDEAKDAMRLEALQRRRRLSGERVF